MVYLPDLSAQFIQNLRGVYPTLVSGALRFEKQDDGGYLFTSALDHGRVAGATIEEANANVLRFGLSQADLHDQPGQSIHTTALVRHWRKQLEGQGYKVNLFSFVPETDEQWNQIYQRFYREGRHYGWTLPDQASARHMSVMASDGTELTTQEIFDKLGMQGRTLTAKDIEKGKMGLMDPRTGLSNKAMKRGKAYQSPRTYESLQEGAANRVKIGVFGEDPFVTRSLIHDQLKQHFGKTWDLMSDKQRAQLGVSGQDGRQQFINARISEAVETASDGAAIAGEKWMNSMIASQEKMLDQQKLALTQAENRGDFAEVKRLRSEVRTLERGIKDLTETKRRKGGIFNVRVAGAEMVPVFDYSGDVDFPSTGKFNIVYNPDVFQQYAREAKIVAGDVDIISHIGNMTREIGLIGDDVSVMTATPFDSSMMPLLDEQTLTSNADLFTRQKLERMGGKTLQRYQEALNSMLVTGRIPEEFRQVILSSANSAPDEASRNAALSVLNAIEDMGDSYDLRVDKRMYEQAQSVLYNSMFRTSDQHRPPKVFLENAMRGEIIPRQFASRSVRKALDENYGRAGFLDPSKRHRIPILEYDRTLDALVFDAHDGVRLQAALGGFDWDDSMIGIARANMNSILDDGFVHVLGIRQPNTAAEHIAFATHINSDFFQKMIDHRIRGRGLFDSDPTLDDELVNRMKQMFKEYDPTKPITAQHRQAMTQHLDRLFGEVAYDDIGPRFGVPGSGSRIGSVLGSEKFYSSDGKSFRFEGSDLSFRAFDASDVDEVKKMKAVAESLFPGYESLTYQQQLKVFDAAGMLTNRPQSPIGMYINPRMVFDEWLHNFEVQETSLGLDARTRRAYTEILDEIKLIETETLIDRATVEFARERAEDLVGKIYELAAYSRGKGFSDLGLDQELIDRRASGYAEAKQIGIDRAVARLQAEGISISSMDESSLMLDPTSQYARYSYLQSLGGQIDEASEAARYYAPDEIRVYSAARSRPIDAIVDRMAQAAKTSVAQDDIMRIWAEQDSIRGVLDVLDTTLDDTGKATSRTWDTIVRSIQRADGDYAAGKVVDALRYVTIQEGDRTLSALVLAKEYAEKAQMIGPSDFDVQRLTRESLEEAGSLPVSNTLRRELQHILDAHPHSGLTLSMVDDIDKGLTSAFGRSAGIADEVARALHSQDSPFRIGALGGEGALGSVFSSSMLIDVKDSQGKHQRLSSIVQEITGYMRNEGAHKSANAENVVNALKVLREDLLQYVSTSPDADPVLRDYVFRSFSRDPRDKAALDSAKKAQARILGDASGGQYRRMSRAALTDLIDKVPPGVKKGFGFGAAAMMALAVVNRVRNKEHTRNDMQGPAFMPGGTPYDEGFPMDTSHMYAPSGGGFGGFGGGGTTYEISGRGGSYNDSFVSDLSAIVGSSAAVSANISDGQLPFKSEGARDRMLRQYS